MGRILRLLFYISCTIVGLILSFVFINVGLNWYERTFKDIDYDHLKCYCHNNGLNEHYAVVVDFSGPSGKHRFFVCDLKKQEIISSSLCAHGSGKGSTVTKPVFSNEVGSNCSSLGHYAITGRHKMSSTGLPSFRLEGLDPIGWCVCDGYQWVEFNHYKTKLEVASDGSDIQHLEALVIDYQWLPETEEYLLNEL